MNNIISQYQADIGRKGGKSTSARKLASCKRNARKPKPGLANFFRLMKKVAGNPDLQTIERVMSLSTRNYPIDEVRAGKILYAAKAYASRRAV